MGKNAVPPYTVRARIGHVTDIHLNPLNRIPAARTDTYHEDTRKELEGLRTWLIEQRITALLISGDLFNLKNSSLYFPEHLLYYRDYFASLPCPVYTIPGNHDLPQSAYTNLSKSAYKLLLEACPNIIDVSDRVVRHTCPDGLEVAISGVPYTAPDHFAARASALSARIATESPGILNFTLIHTDIVPAGNNNPTFFEAITFDDACDALSNTDLICAGHIHLSYPLYTRRHTRTGRPQMLSKPYSCARLVKDYYTSLADLAERHVPSATLFELRATTESPLSLHAEYTQLPCVDFAHAFQPEALVRELEKSETIASFITSLKTQYGSISAAFTLDTPADYLAKLTIPDEVRAVIEEYLTA